MYKSAKTSNENVTKRDKTSSKRQEIDTFLLSIHNYYTLGSGSSSNKEFLSSPRVVGYIKLVYNLNCSNSPSCVVIIANDVALGGGERFGQCVSKEECGRCLYQALR